MKRLVLRLLLICLWTCFLGRVCFAQTPTCSNLIKKLIQRPDLVLLPKLGEGSFEIVRAKEAMPTLFPEAVPPPGWHDLMKMAHHYNITFSHKGVPEFFGLIVPALPGNRPDLQMLLQLEEILTQLPTQILRKMDYLVINPAQNRTEREYMQNLQYSPSPEEYVVGATVRQNDFRGTHIDVYPKTFEQTFPEALGIFRHELGHVAASKYYGQLNPDQRWANAIMADSVVVSRYALNSGLEDFAETVRVYLSTEGGLLSPRARWLLARRFALLDEIFEVDRGVLQSAMEVEK